MQIPNRRSNTHGILKYSKKLNDISRRRKLVIVAVAAVLVFLVHIVGESDVPPADQPKVTESLNPRTDVSRTDEPEIPFPDSKPFASNAMKGKRYHYSPSAQLSAKKNTFRLHGLGTDQLFQLSDGGVGTPPLSLSPASNVGTLWEAYQHSLEGDPNFRAERWPLSGSRSHDDVLTLIDPPTMLVIDEYDIRDEMGRNGHVNFVPVDDWHLSKTVLKEKVAVNTLAPEDTQDDSEVFTEYDFPERASDFARPGSIWFELVSQYANSPIEKLLGSKDQGKGLCHISAMVTGNCYYLSESLEECASRWGTFKFDVTLTHRCRTSKYWRSFMRSEAEQLLNRQPTSSPKLSGALNRHDSQTSILGRVFFAFKDSLVNFWMDDELAFGSPLKPKTSLSPIQHLLSTWTSVESKTSLERSANAVRPSRSIPEKESVNALMMPKTVSAEICSMVTNTDDSRINRYSSEKPLPAPFGKPRVCTSDIGKPNASQYPIAFGTPLRNMQNQLLPKLFDFIPISLDPNQKPLSANDEDLYQSLAALSYYCPTHARGGWDCGRHYEVMGAGCVPYFIDIHAMPPYILSQMPVRLFQEIVREPQFKHIGYVTGAVADTYGPLSVGMSGISSDNDAFEEASKAILSSSNYRVGIFNNRTRIYAERSGNWHFDHSQFDVTNYWRVARKLLKFTRKYLTSEALASYVLTTMGAADAKRVLVVSRNGYDNVHMSLVTGLDGLGVETTVTTNRKLQTLYKCFKVNSENSKSCDIHHPDTHLLATVRTGPKVKRQGAHGYGIPWANRVHNGDKLIFTASISHVAERLTAHINNAAKRLLAIEELRSILRKVPRLKKSAPSSSLAFQKADIAPHMSDDMRTDDVLASIFRLTHEHRTYESEMSSPYYDAIIFSFYDPHFPIPLLKYLNGIGYKGKVALIDHEDTQEDPKEGSVEAARHAFFFSRELRRVEC